MKMVVLEMSSSKQVENMVVKCLSLDIEESNKLKGTNKYKVWQFKMKALFDREKLWSVVETCKNLITFPILIGRKLYTKEKLIDANNTAHFAMVLSCTSV